MGGDSGLQEAFGETWSGGLGTSWLLRSLEARPSGDARLLRRRRCAGQGGCNLAARSISGACDAPACVSDRIAN